MFSQTLLGFYLRDIDKLYEEIASFGDENNLWKTIGQITNPAGNLALHLVGGLNYFIGTQLGKTGYVRNRAFEFSQKHVPRSIILEQIAKLKAVVFQVMNTLKDADYETDFPIPFDDKQNTTGYVLVQLHGHLLYHLGQINYLRRAMS